MTKIVEDDFQENEMFVAPAPRVAVSGNPLKKYFRLPGVNVTLPSGGRFNDVQFQSDGTVQVFPMRAADELLLNSPDALMSGAAIESLIESCVPAVSDPKNLPIPDVDVILLAIRASSAGDTMDVEAECEKCKVSTTFEANLGDILATAKPIPEDTDVRLSDDLLVHLRPHTLQTQTKVLNAAFFEQRKAQALVADESLSEDDKQSQLNAIYTRIASLEIDIVAEAVVKIVTPAGDVTEQTYIKEFMRETSKDWVKQLRSRLDDLNASMDKSIEVECPACQHQWKAEISFDPSSFFGQGSSA